MTKELNDVFIIETIPNSKLKIKVGEIGPKDIEKYRSSRTYLIERLRTYFTPSQIKEIIFKLEFNGVVKFKNLSIEIYTESKFNSIVAKTVEAKTYLNKWIVGELDDNQN